MVTLVFWCFVSREGKVLGAQDRCEGGQRDLKNPKDLKALTSHLAPNPARGDRKQGASEPSYLKLSPECRSRP